QPMVLLHAYDPANLYGPTAPLGWPLSGESASNWARRNSNWLITQAGQIILALENHGKRLWPNPQASAEQLFQAIQRTPSMLKQGHGVDIRAKLVVEEWNGAAATKSPARELLESVGFVHDYHSMCWYAN
ncbi:MAG TPA: hypothetical protein PKD72_06715, partial [Gemmatales bacterium]|nr:hypothetical protein [Gemmatales bacterium]